MGIYRHIFGDELRIVFTLSYEQSLPIILEKFNSPQDFKNFIDEVYEDTSRRKIGLLLEIAKELINRGNYDLAEYVLSKINHIPAAKYYLARLYYKLKDYNKSQRYLNECNIGPEHQGAILLQHNVWRKLKRLDLIILDVKKVLKDPRISKIIKDLIKINLGYASLVAYQAQIEYDNLFADIESYFMNLCENYADACYGMVFLYDIAYSLGNIDLEEAVNLVMEYFEKGSRLDEYKNSKHFNQAQNVLLKLQNS